MRPAQLVTHLRLFEIVQVREENSTGQWCLTWWVTDCAVLCGEIYMIDVVSPDGWRWYIWGVGKPPYLDQLLSPTEFTTSASQPCADQLTQCITKTWHKHLSLTWVIEPRRSLHRTVNLTSYPSKDLVHIAENKNLFLCLLVRLSMNEHKRG